MDINPLDFTGPAFLVFYLICMLAVLSAIQVALLKRERRFPSPQLNLTDPYEIAYLRGGAKEAIKIAVLSLIDRGLLIANNPALVIKSDLSPQLVKRPLEKVILEYFSETRAAMGILVDGRVMKEADCYLQPLKDLRVIAGAKTFAERKIPIFLGGLFLLGLAGSKIAVALSRGRTNIVFLIILSVISIALLSKQFMKRRTHLGEQVLVDLKVLFKGLYNRQSSLKPGGETNEAALFMAIYGIAMLTAVGFPASAAIFPAPTPATGGSGSDSSFFSSSCGGGSGCGGSCGGGCGGCGS